MPGTRRAPVSGLTLLAAAVLLLLPVLAWLQYSWLNQIAQADRERRTRTLETAAQQLSHELDAELGRAFAGLQIDPSIVEAQAWGSYDHGYDAWAGGALHAGVVEHVYLAAFPGTRTGEPTLRVWRPATTTFDEVAWPADLEPVRARLAQHATHVEVRTSERGRADRLVLPPSPLSDERTLIAPIVRVRAPEPGPDGMPRPGPADARVLGFTVVRFNLEAVRATLLPTLVTRHFDGPDGTSEFRVAVVEREHPDRVVYESDAGAAAMAVTSPDAEAPLLFLRNDRVFTLRGGARRTERALPRGASPPPEERVMVSVIERGGRPGGVPQPRLFPREDGRWRLVAKHRAGSLEAAVAGARARSLALSSGILALLAAAIGLIVVSARRADRLAKQQVEFVAAVSHELRTPVSVIGAAAGNLADGIVADPGRVRTYGATIQAEARRLGETVERVLQLAGIMSGRPAASEALAPGALVEAAVAACRADIDAAGAQVDIDVPTEVPAVAGDRAALQSALRNLVSNAVKYGGQARWVGVSVRAADGKGGSRFVDFRVEDRGLGIGPDERKHVFDPFFRGREAVVRQIQGSGLGLTLVQRIAEAHGGSVSVTSEPGRGSAFTLRLPAAGDAAVRVGAVDAALSPLGSSR